jgi:hypothetical protein
MRSFLNSFVDLTHSAWPVAISGLCRVPQATPVLRRGRRDEAPRAPLGDDTASSREDRRRSPAFALMD